MPRQKQAAEDAERADALRARVQTVVDRYSQAEVARRLGTSRSNVSRYLRGARVPLDFAGALVDKFGVDPAWLLTGEGAAFRDEVPADTSHMAGSLLELIKGMSAVEHMKLGALTGKHHLRVLRELRDAMDRHDDLRNRLNRHSVPVLRVVLDDLRKALAKPDLDRARELGRTAEQLGRFCDDTDVSLELVILMGRLNTLERDLHGALRWARGAIVHSFNRGGQLGEEEFEAVVEAVNALHGFGRFSEARRIADAATVLATDEARNSENAYWLMTLIAEMQTHTGELRQAIDTMMDIRGRLTGLRGLRADGVLARALLLAGALDINAAIAFGGDYMEKVYGICGIAALREREDELAIGMAYWERVLGPQEFMWIYRADYLLLRALRGEKTGLAKDVRKLVAEKPGSSYLPVDWGPILGAGLYRLIGRENDARRCFKDSCKMVERMPDWLTFTVTWQARHMRNALDLGTSAQKKEAREFFRRHIEAGYRCFADFVA